MDNLAFSSTDIGGESPSINATDLSGERADRDTGHDVRETDTTIGQQDQSMTSSFTAPNNVQSDNPCADISALDTSQHPDGTQHKTDVTESAAPREGLPALEGETVKINEDDHKSVHEQTKCVGEFCAVAKSSHGDLHDVTKPGGSDPPEPHSRDTDRSMNLTTTAKDDIDSGQPQNVFNKNSLPEDPGMEAEQILLLLGQCGRYQLLVYCLIGLVCLRGTWHMFSPIFLGADPGHRCYIPENMTATYSMYINTSVYNSSSEDVEEAANCHMPVPGGGNKTQPCQYGWEYGNSYSSTILTQWDLVCDRSYVVDLASSVFMGGMIVGSLLISPLGDKYGRKRILLVSLLAQGVLGVATAFVDNYIVFLVMRFFLGALNQAIGLVSYVMVSEAYPASNRTIPYIGLFFCWAGGIMSLTLIAYLIRDWKYLEIAISAPNFLMVVYYWLLPESIPWLIAKHKYKEAEAVIIKAAKLNKVSLPPEILNLSSSPSSKSLVGENSVLPGNSQPVFKDGNNTGSDSLVSEVGSTKQLVSEVGYINTETAVNSDWTALESGKTAETQMSGERRIKNETPTSVKQFSNNSSGVPVLNSYKSIPDCDVKQRKSLMSTEVTFPHTYTVIDLVRTPRMRLYTFIMYFLWLVNSLSYFGISFSVPTLHGDTFLNLLISGIVEVPAYLICMVTVECLGRRRPLCVFMLVCGVASIIAIFIPVSTEAGTDLTWLKTTVAMISKFGITGSYVIVYLLCVEIFPTVVRNLGLGIAAGFETVGGVAAPFIASSAKTVPRLPLTVFGVLTIIGGVVALVLPETHRKHLPETIEDVENFNRKAGKKETVISLAKGARNSANVLSLSP